MRQIAILSYALPPTLEGVSNLIYHHIYQLNQAGYLLRLIAGSGDEAYFEASFHHLIEFYPIPEIAKTTGGAPQQEWSRFEAQRDLLAAQLRPLLEDASLCIAYDTITSAQNLALTAALHRLNEEGTTRFIAWQYDGDAIEAGGSLPSGYPWDLLQSAWPGVRYAASTQSGAERLAGQVGLTTGEVAVIPEGINAAEFFKWEETTRRLVQSFDLLEADPLLLAPGPLGPAANLELPIRATAVLAEDYPQAVLLVAGSPGPDLTQEALAALQALPTGLGIEKNVIFLFDQLGQGAPARPPESVQTDLTRLADLMLLPAFEESSAAALLRASLARLPVLAADIPFYREQAALQPRLFDPHASPAALAAQIEAALKQDPSRPARRRVQEQLTWRAILHKSLIPLIEEASR